MVAPFVSWPWENLGSNKYLLYGPFFAQIAHLWWKGESITNTWSFHIILLWALRSLIHQLWHTYSTMLFLSSNRRINHQGIDFKQIDHEWHWDNFLILQGLVGGLALYMFPYLTNEKRTWDTKGLIAVWIIHMVVSEPLYYAIHRLFHDQPTLFKSYHSLHHLSPVLHPFTDIEGGSVPCSFLTDAKYSNQIAKDLTKPPRGNLTSKTRGNTEQHVTVNVDVNQIQLSHDSPSSGISKGINGHDPGCSDDIVGKCLSNKPAKRTADDYGAHGYNSKKQKQLDQGLPEMNQGSTTSEAVNLENSVCAGSDMTNTRNNTDNQKIFDFDSGTLLNFKCAFCQTWKITEGSGPMQHFANGRQLFAHEASHSHVVHLHQSCLDWAPQIFYVNDTTIKNLDKELARAGKLKCSRCGLKGAALGCYVKSCRKSYHAPCAFEVKECRWDDDHFLMLCPDHASQKFPREKSKKLAPKNCSSAPGHNEKKNSRDLDFWATSPSGAKNWVFCGSALSADEKYMLVKLANLCGATVTKSWNPNVTHVIAATDSNGACSRTLKVLMAILNGRWILKTDWIEACMQSKLPINEEPYEISLDNHGCCNGPKTGRLRLLNNEQKLFDNLKFFFYGDFVSSFKRDLQNLVMTAGGTILKADELQPSSGEQCYQPSTSIVVYNDDSIEVNEILQLQVEAEKVALESGSQVIAYTWILDSIASGLLKPFVRKM